MQYAAIHRSLRLFGACALMVAAFVGGNLQPAVATEAAGAVYALTNAPSGNAVVMWRRAADGTLSHLGTFPTGGIGIGGGLGSQGAVILSDDSQWLFAVDAGSNGIASFKVRPDGLNLTNRIASGGQRPTSLTLHDRLLYVLNAGGTGNITGFTIADDGSMSPLPDSTRPLSGDTTAPAQVGFSPDGTVLVVTERATQTIDTYVVGTDGRVSGPTAQRSSGATPFGFAFGKRGQLFVSEANGIAPGQSAVSSYTIGTGGTLTVVSGSSPTYQAAACWLVVTNHGRYAYTSNAGSDSISGYRIGIDGSLTLLNANGRTASTGDGTGPTDMALSGNSQFLYVRGGAGTIGAFAVQPDGSLQPLGGASGLPVGAAGLAAR